MDTEIEPDISAPSETAEPSIDAAELGTPTEITSDGTPPAPTGPSGTPAPAASGNPAEIAAQRKQAASNGPAGAPKTPTTTPNTTGAPPAHIDPLKSLNDAKADFGRQKAEFDRRLAAQDAQLKTFQSEHQKREQEAAKANLKQWNRNHPNQPQAMRKIQNVAAYMRAMEAATPEQQADPKYMAGLAQRMQVTKEDGQLYDQYQADREEITAQFQADPDGFIQQRAEQVAGRLIQDAFAQFQQHATARADVEKDIGLLAKHRELSTKLLNDKVPYDHVIRTLKLEDELATLRAGSAQAKTATTVAGEQQRLAKSRASVTRDPVAAPQSAIYEMASKEATRLGIEPGTTKFNKLLVKFEQASK